MRRISLAVLAVTLAVPAIARAQTQDPVVVSANQFAQQGNHDIAIAMLRSALAARPGDAALKAALVDVLRQKMISLSREMLELRREINELGGAPSMASPTLPGRTGPVVTGMAGCAGDAPVRVGGNIMAPAKLKDVKPVYPPAAQSEKVQGIVIVEAVIDCNGDVASVRILRGQPLLDEAALNAVREWKFSQTLLNGVPVKVIFTATVTFRLE